MKRADPGWRWLLIAVLATGCTPEGKGFRLPDGDVDRGRAAFVTLGCNDCHHTADIERASGSSEDLDILLGGPTHQIRTYGQLVTSVINPSHVIARPHPPQPVTSNGQSMMRAYNDVMTVQQLVDVVTFLEQAYELRLPDSYL